MGLGAWVVACSSTQKSEPRAGLSSDYWRPSRLCDEPADVGLSEVTVAFTPAAPVRSTDCEDAGTTCCYQIYFSTCVEHRDAGSDAKSVVFAQRLGERACAGGKCFPLCEDQTVTTIPADPNARPLDAGLVVGSTINWHDYEGLRKFHDREPDTFDPTDTMAVYVTNVPASVELTRDGQQPCGMVAAGPSSALVIPLRADRTKSQDQSVKLVHSLTQLVLDGSSEIIDAGIIDTCP
jgi:hypothetical protein